MCCFARYLPPWTTYLPCVRSFGIFVVRFFGTKQFQGILYPRYPRNCKTDFTKFGIPQKSKDCSHRFEGISTHN